MIPFFSRRRREHDLDEEIRTHFRMAIQERGARGASRTEAERAVLREFGGVGRVKEATRDMWGRIWLDRLVQDLRFGARSLLRDPGFALVAILTLGLGVGVTTAMFTVVNGVLFRPLPFFEPDRLVAVGVQSPEQATGDLHVLDDHFLEIRRQSSSFTLVTTYMSYPPTTLTGAGNAVRMRAAFETLDPKRLIIILPGRRAWEEFHAWADEALPVSLPQRTGEACLMSFDDDWRPRLLHHPRPEKDKAWYECHEIWSPIVQRLQGGNIST